MGRSEPTHAGGIVVRAGERGREVLLVRARKDAALWIFPKGHIEEGETASEAALREVREEAGLEARILTGLGRVTFGPREAGETVAFFLMEEAGRAESDEVREAIWRSIEEAGEVLVFPEARRLLRRARETCARLGRP